MVQSKGGTVRGGGLLYRWRNIFFQNVEISIYRKLFAGDLTVKGDQFSSKLGLVELEKSNT